MAHKRLRVGHRVQMTVGARVAAVSCKARLILAAAAFIGLALAACSGTGAPGSTTAVAPSPTIAPTEPDPSDDRAGSTANGAELYAANCQQCHGDREGKGGIGAPRHDGSGHTWHHPDAQLKDWVLNGKVGFIGMPGLKDTLTESEVDSILVFVKTWWTAEQRSTQADVSRRYQQALDRQNKSQ